MFTVRHKFLNIPKGFCETIQFQIISAAANYNYIIMRELPDYFFSELFSSLEPAPGFITLYMS